MVAPKPQFPLVRWAVVVCSYDDIGTRAAHAGGVKSGLAQFAAIGNQAKAIDEKRKPECVGLSAPPCR